MDTSIFNAFSDAIISNVWQIGSCQRGTVVGNTFGVFNDIDVIVDEGSNATVNTVPERLASDMLVYCMPCQMPTLETNVLVSGYMLYDSVNDHYYEIVDAGLGKNQHTGRVEHVELKVVQTEVVADA